jgi:hypothetical protein
MKRESIITKLEYENIKYRFKLIRDEFRQIRKVFKYKKDFYSKEIKTYNDKFEDLNREIKFLKNKIIEDSIKIQNFQIEFNDLFKNLKLRGII